MNKEDLKFKFFIAKKVAEICLVQATMLLLMVYMFLNI